MIVPPENQGRRSRCSLPREQTADARRIAEHLVEGQRYEVGMMRRQIEPVRRHERGGVEHHVPTMLVRQIDPRKRVLDAGKIRLRGIGEEVMVPRRHPRQLAHQVHFVHAHFRQQQRHVGRGGAPGARELADAVH